jgi:hypothetical protein
MTPKKSNDYGPDDARRDVRFLACDDAPIQTDEQLEARYRLLAYIAKLEKDADKIAALDRFEPKVHEWNRSLEEEDNA